MTGCRWFTKNFKYPALCPFWITMLGIWRSTAHFPCTWLCYPITQTALMWTSWWITLTGTLQGWVRTRPQAHLTAAEWNTRPTAVTSANLNTSYSIPGWVTDPHPSWAEPCGLWILCRKLRCSGVAVYAGPLNIRCLFYRPPMRFQFSPLLLCAIPRSFPSTVNLKSKTAIILATLVWFANMFTSSKMLHEEALPVASWAEMVCAITSHSLVMCFTKVWRSPHAGLCFLSSPSIMVQGRISHRWRRWWVHWFWQVYGFECGFCWNWKWHYSW